MEHEGTESCTDVEGNNPVEHAVPKLSLDLAVGFSRLNDFVCEGVLVMHQHFLASSSLLLIALPHFTQAALCLRYSLPVPCLLIMLVSAVSAGCIDACGALGRQERKCGSETSMSSISCRAVATALSNSSWLSRVEDDACIVGLWYKITTNIAIPSPTPPTLEALIL